ncbi:Uma2 family endonuclease [Amycolatopsis roodepoortensis]|uniref:Uma2 family endonuclease n=1 Tax=Amycolatopsis roodepoortensis TaxID=700274 RepID=UPI00214B6708|nr:Uma2 family endonuclease [Amycolatopsis roodepoortensis]UUV28391.1 Uma2 family endonuclease [Amycolatopsis roodepoortensis]
MSVVQWPHRLLTLDDWAALPEDPEHCAEVVEGVLVVAPRPMSFHQLAVTRLGYLLNEQLPEALMALSEAEFIVSEVPLTIRVPDVLVAATEFVERNPARYAAEDVRLVIEVLSVGTVRTDRVTKFSEYAEVGIEHYWIVDLEEPASMTTYRLIDGEYENFGEHTGKVSLDLDGTPLTLDLDALTTRHAQRP